MPVSPRWRLALLTAAVLSTAVLGTGAHAQQAAVPKAETPDTPISNSDIDAPLFYQLLIGEMELRSGQPGTAYEVILDAARRGGVRPSPVRSQRSSRSD